MNRLDLRETATAVVFGLGNGASTFVQSLRWALRRPALLVAFLAVQLSAVAGWVLQAAFVPLTVVLSLVAIAVTYRYTRELAADKDTTAGGVLGVAASLLGQLVTLALVFFLYVAFVIIGLVLFVLPGIYAGVRLTLAFPACVIDGHRAFDSLDAGWAVAEGTVAELFGIAVLWLLGGGVVYTVPVVSGRLVLAPRVVLLLSPVIAVVSAAATLSVGRIYVENRQSMVESEAGV